MMAADDGLSGAGVVTEQPEWIDGLPHCDERCQQHDGKRCRLLGFPPGRAVFCEPSLDAMRGDRDALRATTRALVEKLEALDREWRPYLDAEPSYAPELAAVREALGGDNHA